MAQGLRSVQPIAINRNSSIRSRLADCCLTRRRGIMVLKMGSITRLRAQTSDKNTDEVRCLTINSGVLPFIIVYQISDCSLQRL